LNGDCQMTDEAISDTGPILHLNEIGKLESLNIFERLYVTGLVANELSSYDIDLLSLDLKTQISLVDINDENRFHEITKLISMPIHPADTEVFILAREKNYSIPILTDDLTLRRQFEQQGALVIGTMGILVKAYHNGLMNREDLEGAIDLLFEESTLFISRAFRSYIRKLLANLK